MRSICESCEVEKCNYECNALKQLVKLYREERRVNRYDELKELAYLLNIWDAFPDKEMEELGNKIITKYDQFGFITDLDLKIGYAKCTQPKQEKGERVLGECVKIKPFMKAWIPFDFIIVFYDLNIDYLDEKQIQILMMHELQHIGLGPKGIKINEHDVKDFSNLITAHGINWADYDEQVADILRGDSNE